MSREPDTLNAGKAQAADNDAQAKPADGAMPQAGGLMQQSLAEINDGYGANGAEKTARAGVDGPGSAMPHQAAIQRSFGRHDISGMRAHVGGNAKQASQAMGAKAYATGNDVAFGSQPDLHTAAHEAAHVVQQREGAVSEKGVGAADSGHEQQADKVADAVVAGKSAEPLLDEAKGSGGPAAKGDVVQRKLADDVKGKALAPINHQIGGGHMGAKLGGFEWFSGQKAVTLHHDTTGTGQAVQQAFDEITGPSGPAHGTPESLIEGVFPQRFPELYNTAAFNWMLGSATSNAYPAGLPVSAYLHKLLYPTEGGPWQVTGGLDYKRNSNTDKFTTSLDISNNVMAKVLSGSIWGTQQLETQSDADLFGQWTVRQVPQSFVKILGSMAETEGFVNVLKPVGAAGLSVWYGYARRGLFGGKKAREWATDTFKDETLQLGVIRSLQLLYKEGVGQANEDLDELVDGIRGIIEDPKTEQGKKTILQNRLVNSYLWKNLVIDASDVPDRPNKTPDTPDANFDMVRLAGKILAQRQLIPQMQDAFDLVEYAKNYPVETQPHLGTDMTRMVTLEAEAMSKRMQKFLSDGITPESLGPACFGPEGVCGPESKLPRSGLDLSQYNLAMGTARLGAVEAMREAAAAMPASGNKLTAHLAAHQGFVGIDTAYSPQKGVNKSVGYVANLGVTQLSDVLHQDNVALARVEEVMDSGSNENERRRAAGIERFRGLITDYRTTKDLASLRKEIKESRIEDGKEIKVDVIQGLAVSQAAAAKTEANLAYTTAATRYQADFIKNLEGKYDARKDGSQWTTTGMMAMNGLKEMLDVGSALAGAKAVAPAAGPIVGVALVALDAIITFHDWWAKAKIEKAKTAAVKKFTDAMNAGEKETLGKIQSNTATEVALHAKGKVRPAAGMDAYMTTLTQGKNAKPPEPIDLSQMTRAKLEEFYNSMVANPGIPHTALYQMYLGGIMVTGNPMWEKFMKEIEDLPQVWK